MQHPTDRITHTIAFVTPVVEHWMDCVTKELACIILSVDNMVPIKTLLLLKSKRIPYGTTRKNFFNFI